jgi:pimeloyl-ACP methyl ester carboxylesterase
MRQERIAVDGIALAASASGDAGQPAILLLHGWPHDRTLYDPVIDRLGERFYVLALDLPGVGESSGQPSSAEKRALADVVLTAAEQAGARSPIIAGIDVGGMIAFAAARDHDQRISGAAIGNTVVPGLDPWCELIADPRIWHFAFHAVPELPELLVAGEERSYFDFFFDALGNKDCPLAEAVRDRFAQSYRRPEALKAGFDWYRAFEADAKRNAEPKPIEAPILYFRGDADGRSTDDYVAGLRTAGARNLRGQTLTDTAEFAPVEAPERFAEMIEGFAERCFAREPATA